MTYPVTEVTFAIGTIVFVIFAIGGTEQSDRDPAR